MLQCVAVRCSALQCVAVCFSMLIKVVRWMRQEKLVCVTEADGGGEGRPKEQS